MNYTDALVPVRERAGATPPPPPYPVLERQWLAALAPGTQSAYTRELHRFLRWWQETGHAEPPFTASVGDARAYQAARMAEAGPAGVARSMAAMSSLWRSAAVELAAWGIDLSNPWTPKATRRPHPARKVDQRILPEEADVQTLLRACQTGHERALVLGLYHTGARVEELLGCHWSDIHPSPQGWLLTIEPTPERTVKGKQARTVGISLAALEALRAIRRVDSDWLFPWGDGRWPYHTAWRAFKRLAARAGMPYVTPHWLRHSAASHAHNNGADLATIRDQLGHSSLAVTSVYVHARPGRTLADFLPGGDRGAPSQHSGYYETVPDPPRSGHRKGSRRSG